MLVNFTQVDQIGDFFELVSNDDTICFYAQGIRSMVHDISTNMINHIKLVINELVIPIFKNGLPSM